MQFSSKASVAAREALVELFEQGWGYRSAAMRVGVGCKTSEHLWDRWRIHGRIALVAKPFTSRYSFEFKLQAVQRALGGETRPAIAKDLGLSSPKLLDKWLSAYRSKGEQGLRPQPKGRPKKDPSKPVKPVSEIDQLKRRLEFLEVENAYLKALRDLMTNQR